MAAPAQASIDLGKGGNPHAVVDPDGTAHVVWVEGKASGDADAVHECNVMSHQSPGPADCRTVDYFPPPGSGADDLSSRQAFIFSAAGALYLFTGTKHGSNEGESVYKSTDGGQTWPAAPTGSGQYYFPAAVMGSATDEVFGAFIDGGDRVSANAFPAAGPETSTRAHLDDPAVSHGTQIAIGLDGGNPLVVWDDFGGGLRYARYVGSGGRPGDFNDAANWRRAATPFDADPEIRGFALSGGPAGLFLLKQAQGQRYPIVRRYNSGAGFGPPMRSDCGDAANFVNGIANQDLYQDPSGRLHIVYSGLDYAGNDTVRYVTRSGAPGDPSPPVTVDSTPILGGQPHDHIKVAANASGTGLALWDTGNLSGEARMTWLPQPPPPGCPSAALSTLSRLSLGSKVFRAAKGGPTIARRGKHPVGTTVSYTDSRAAVTTFTVSQQRPGVKRRGKCVKRSKKRKGKRCKLIVRLGSFVHQDSAGRNSFRFSGRLNGKALKPGRYVLTAVPAAGAQHGGPVSVAFQVVKR